MNSRGSNAIPKALGLAAMMREFDRGTILTAREIAERHGCSIRTAQRWLTQCAEIYPIYDEPVPERRIYRGSPPLGWRRLDYPHRRP
jgi:predicted DNA-binding transcriptional regulator YafY